MSFFGNNEGAEQAPTPENTQETPAQVDPQADVQPQAEQPVAGSTEPENPTETGEIPAVETPAKTLVNKVDGNSYEVLSEQDMGDHVMVNTPAFGVRFEKTEDGVTSDTWELKDQE